ncbi:MAG: CPBP family intramembrane metalloprotease [Chloroflexota bacterium]|nr:CPBP family intramembrane metalloprotease [Chloroflexota bacterium]
MRWLPRVATILLGGLALAWPGAILLAAPTTAPDPHDALKFAVLLLGALTLRIHPSGSSAAVGAVAAAVLIAAAVALVAPLPAPFDPTLQRMLVGGVGLGVALAVVGMLLLPVLVGRRPRLSASPLAWVVGIYLAFDLARFGLGRVILAVFPDAKATTPTIDILGGLGAEIVLLLCLASLVRATAAIGWRKLGFVPMPLTRVLGIGVAVAMLNLLVVVTINSTAEHFGLDPAHTGNVRPLLPGASRPEFVPAVVADAVVPAGVEELIFRGALFGVLLRPRVPLWLAITLSSGLFALGHLQASMVALQLVSVGVGFFIVACVLAVAYQRSGSLYPSIVAHALFNLPATLGLSLSEDAGRQFGLLLFAGTFLALTFLFPDLRRNLTRREDKFGAIRRRLMSVLRQVNPRVDFGPVELRPTTHLVLVAALAVYFPIVMPRSDGVVLALVLYGLVQGALIAGRGARAAAAVRSGRRVEVVRLAPFLSIHLADGGTREAVRRTGAAGIFALAGYGAVLICIGSWQDSAWPALAREMVVLVGWWCLLTSIADLLPLKPPIGHESHELWARIWQPRPRWLVYLPALVLWSFGSVLVSLQFPSGYMRQLLDFVRSTPAGFGALVFFYVGAVLAASRHTPAIAQRTDRVNLH